MYSKVNQLYKKKYIYIYSFLIFFPHISHYRLPLLYSRSLLEKAMAPHSSTLAWKVPWTEEPGRLQSTGSLRVRHDWTTSLSLFTCMHWRRKWQPTPVFLPGESQGRRGAWWAAVYGVAQSRTRLKRLSSSSSILSYAWRTFSLLTLSTRSQDRLGKWCRFLSGS